MDESNSAIQQFYAVLESIAKREEFFLDTPVNKTYSWSNSIVSRGPDSHTPGESLVKLLYPFCSGNP